MSNRVDLSIKLTFFYKNVYATKFKLISDLFSIHELDNFLPLVLHPLINCTESITEKQFKFKTNKKSFLLKKILKYIKIKQITKRRRRRKKNKINVKTEMGVYHLYTYPLTKIFVLKKKKYMAPLLEQYWWYKFFLKLLNWQQLAFHNDWKLVDANKIIRKGAYQKIIRQLYTRKFLRFFYRKWITFLYWFCPLTILKNPISYTTPVMKWLSRANLKRHKRMFYRISHFLRIWYLTLYRHNKIKGYCVFFKGKLGRKGSVRKKKFFAKKGEVSYSTKSLKVNYHTFKFFTITGVVGGGLSVFY